MLSPFKCAQREQSLKDAGDHAAQMISQKRLQILPAVPLTYNRSVSGRIVDEYGAQLKSWCTAMGFRDAKDIPAIDAAACMCSAIFVRFRSGDVFFRCGDEPVEKQYLKSAVNYMMNFHVSKFLDLRLDGLTEIEKKTVINELAILIDTVGPVSPRNLIDCLKRIATTHLAVDEDWNRVLKAHRY